MDAQIRPGLVEETAELDRRYRLAEQARRPGRRRNAASQTHGYREFVRVAASTGKATAEHNGADLAATRTEALGRIWAYPRRQQPWFRKLGASRIDRRSAVKTIVREFPATPAGWAGSGPSPWPASKGRPVTAPGWLAMSAQ